MQLFLTALVLLLTAAQVEAGAWPRDAGTAFGSLSRTYSTGRETILAPDRDLRRSTSLFAEYGMTPALTIGLDASRAASDETDSSTALVFLRRLLRRSDGGNVVSAEFGLGLLDEGWETQTRLRPGLSWGQGFESGWGSGWTGVDTSLVL